MIESIFEREPCITVAVAFDGHTRALVQAALALCRLAGKELALVHVVEPWLSTPVFSPYGDGEALGQLHRVVESRSEAEAAARLEELAGSVPRDIKVRRAVARGKAAESLAAEAQRLGTSLLLVGSQFAAARRTPRGFSTALSLMAAAPMPVAVLDGTLAHALPDDAPRLLLADDLGPQSAAAATFTFDLANRLTRTQVRHVHVCGVSEETVRAALTTATAAEHASLNPLPTAAALFKALEKDLLARLRERGGNAAARLAGTSGRVVPELRHGRVIEELEKVSNDFDPHVVIFGRHHAYYTQPFFPGRVPYRAMMTLRKPVIVVPNE